MANFLNRLKKSKTSSPVEHKELKPFNDSGPDDEIIRLLTPAEAEDLRHSYLTGEFQRRVDAVFTKDQSLNSLMLYVGQYWCDEAVDAVQLTTIYSELEVPDDSAWRTEDFDETGIDDVNFSDGRSPWSSSPLEWPKMPDNTWAANSYCIPLFAAFCVEGGHQEGASLEFESPLALFQRSGPKETTMTFVGEMVRPWLDGASYQSADGFDPVAIAKWAS